MLPRILEVLKLLKLKLKAKFKLNKIFVKNNDKNPCKP